MTTDRPRSRITGMLAVLALLLALPTPSIAQTEAPTATRLAGPDPIGTAAAVARDAFPDGAATVYLARVDVLADALAAGSLTDGPVLLVPSCGPVPEPVTAAIADLDPVTVVALGGEQAVCADLLTDAADGRPTDRNAGASRLDTAAAIASRSFPDGAPIVYLADADIGPDAIVAGTVTQGPILLTTGSGTVPDVVLAALQQTDPDAIYILGGTAAVDDEVAVQLTASPRRLAGPSRVQTAIAVSRHQFGLGSATGTQATSVYLTDDAALAEAVAAGAATDGPVLLVPQCADLPDQLAAEILRLGPERIVAVGDQDVLCDAVLDAAVQAATPDELVAAPTVIPLTTAQARVLDVTSTTVQLQATEDSRALNVGDIVAFEPDPAVLPQGWIVEVQDVQTTGDTLTLTVTAATVEQVLTQGTLTLPPADAGFNQVTESLSVNLCPEAQQPCTAEGRITAELTVDPFVQIDVDSRTFLIGSDLSGSLSGTVQLRERQSFTGPQAYRQLPVIPIPNAGVKIGPFAVGAIFVPAIVLEAHGRVDVTGSATLSTEVSGTVGASIVDGDVTMLPLDGDVTSSLELRAGAKGRISPQMYVEGLVTFGAGPVRADGQLSAGAEVGLRAPITVGLNQAGALSCSLAVDGFVDLETTLFGREVSAGLELPLHAQDLCPVPPEGSLLPDGFGDVAFGDPESTVRGHMFREYGLPTLAYSDDERCTDGRTLTVKGASWGPVSFVFEELDGVSVLQQWIVRAAAPGNAAVSTPRGAGVTSTRQEWIDAYSTDWTVRDDPFAVDIRRVAGGPTDYLLFFTTDGPTPDFVTASGEQRCERVFE